MACKTLVADPEFLTLVEVLKIHAQQLAAWGGGEGVTHPDKLDSALAQPEATFGGEYLHRDLFEMAAAYAYHISEAQAFLDGSKRTGANVALHFLELNSVALEDQGTAIYDALMAIANGGMTKWQLGELFRNARRVM